MLQAIIVDWEGRQTGGNSGHLLARLIAHDPARSLVNVHHLPGFGFFHGCTYCPESPASTHCTSLHTDHRLANIPVSKRFARFRACSKWLHKVKVALKKVVV